MRIFSNVSLGTATLDPAAIAPNSAVDLWLPITGQGELHIFAQSTPLTARNPAKGTRLSTFRMILERTVFFPGEVVRGALVFNVGMPLKIRGVRVKFEGFTKTSWSETRGTDQQRRTVWYHSHIVYFNPVATLYGNPKGMRGDMVIPSGGYFWPFEFVLPSNLAPSYQHSYGQNSYFVKGYVDIPMGFDRTVTEPLTMTVQYGTLQPTLYTKTSGKAKAIFASDQHISVSVTTAPVAYMGQPFEVTLTIVNQGTKAVREVLITLQMKAFFTASSVEGRETKTIGAEILSHKVAGIAGFPVPPGQTWSGKIRVQIPNKIAPSIPASCSPLIQIFHTLKTRVNTEGNFFTKASNEKKFPILIGEVYPFAPQIVVQSPSVQPGMIVIAQPPPDVYKYLAPAPMAGDVYNPVGHVVPHDVFAAQGVVQCEQYVETVPNSVNYDPSQSYGPTGYSFGASGNVAQQGYLPPPTASPGPQYAQQPTGMVAQQGYAAPQATYAQQPTGMVAQQGYAAPQATYAQQPTGTMAQQGYSAASPQYAAQQTPGTMAQQGYDASSPQYAAPGQAAPSPQYAAPGQAAPSPQYAAPGQAAPLGYPVQQPGYAMPQPSAPSPHQSPAPGMMSQQGYAPPGVVSSQPYSPTQAQQGYAAPGNNGPYMTNNPYQQQGMPSQGTPSPAAAQGVPAQAGYQPPAAGGY